MPVTCIARIIIFNFLLQVVVVVGNSLSGQDISMELVEVAKEVHLSAKSLNISEGLSKVISKHNNLHLHPQVFIIYTSALHKTILVAMTLNKM